jgi:hypothetical protein
MKTSIKNAPVSRADFISVSSLVETSTAANGRGILAIANICTKIQRPRFAGFALNKKTQL